jgi:hypothetical protein
MIPGKRLVLLGQVIRSLPCYVDNKALWAQFLGEMQGPQLLLKAAIYDPGGAAHVIETVPSRQAYLHALHMPLMGQYQI